MSLPISVIIPALNEAQELSETIERARGAGEILVVDGGSSDGTAVVARRSGAEVVASRRGRAAQMNAGGARASCAMYLFLHADTWLQPGALENLDLAMRDGEIVGGGFRREFRTHSIFLKMTCGLAGWRNRAIGWHLGDQAIFCRASIFRELGGFREMRAFEDVDFSRRLARRGRVVTLKPAVLSSARRFEAGAVKRTLKDFLLTLKYLARPKTFFAACVLFLLASPLAAERSGQWQVFPAGELPTFSVTVSPRGRVFARQQDGLAMTILDGFSSRQLSLPENIGARIFESRSGQLWSLSTNGLYLFQRGQWTIHPIAEARLEISRPFRPRPISIVPAEVDRALVLLPDRLLDYESATRRVLTLKTAAETGLGQFYEMVETSDGGLLISGSNGVARVAGPLRHLNAQTPWQELRLTTNFNVELQRPAEMADGSVIVVGFDRERPGVRHVLVGSMNAADSAKPWTDTEVMEKIRVAWPGWAGTRWAASYNSLYRLTSKPPFWVRERSDTYFDVAPQTNGVFWLATASGLIRYAPLLWRTPSELSAAELGETPPRAMTQGEDSLWLATAEGLVRVSEGKAERFAWPEESEAALAATDEIFETPNGMVLLDAGRRCSVFSPATKRFGWLVADAEIATRAIGRLRDGSACVRVTKGAETVVEKFDGKELKPFVSSLRALGLPNDVNFVTETRGGDLWFGGAFGLARWRSGDERAQLFGSNEGLSAERLQGLVEVGEEKMWLAGADSIYELRGEHWELVRSGFQRVHSVLRARDGSIWVSAATGLHRFFNGSWISHGIEEGLPALASQDLAQDRSGRLWAATSRGAVVYFPDADPDVPRTFTPEVVFWEQEESNGVAIRFSGADKWNYTSAERLLFAYRLDEGPWSTFTNASVMTFDKLSGGPHYIQARAMDRNGNKDPSTATLEFAVTLPWSRDPRLIAVVVLALIATVFLAGVAINRHLRLKRSYAEVERMVAERTAQLEKANEELLHSHKMRALGTLAAGIAHDFNNILSIIKGSAQIIENNPEDKEKILTRAGRIQMVVDQGAGIVRSMLGLGKGGDQTECEPGELVDEAVRLLGDRFSADVQVRHEKSETLPRLTCSKGVIHQILQNLVLNAVDACDGKGTITLRTRVTTNPGSGLALSPSEAASYLAIDVIDEGVGIPAEALPRIFEPFYTTKAFSSRRGTGLGLSMVYELAKGLGYGLAVESAPGKGSTFTLLAPLP
jgi:rSAM/selenodomain-associated transferase 2